MSGMRGKSGTFSHYRVRHTVRPIPCFFRCQALDTHKFSVISGLAVSLFG